MSYVTTKDYTGRQVDLEAFPASQIPAGQFQIELTLEHDGQTGRVAGIQKVVQRYVNLLFTPLGGVHFDADAGSSFLVDIHFAGTYTAEQLLHSFVFANAGVIALMQAEDANPDYGIPPADEQLANAQILESSYDNATGHLNLTVQLTTQAGDTVTFVVPAGVQ